MAESSAANFDVLARVMEEMPGLERRVTGLWPYATWFPFIAKPTQHMAFRPGYIEDFASAAAWDIGFSSDLDFRMYEQVCRLAEQIRAELEVSGLNTSRRPLDMIDAQSFMWVAEKYYKRSDGASMVDPDGNETNSWLHEQMTEGVDDTEFALQTRRKLMEAGVPEEHLNRVLPK